MIVTPLHTSPGLEERGQEALCVRPLPGSDPRLVQAVRRGSRDSDWAALSE